MLSTKKAQAEIGLCSRRLGVVEGATTDRG
jgi:hypothetical protein